MEACSKASTSATPERRRVMFCPSRSTTSRGLSCSVIHTEPPCAVSVLPAPFTTRKNCPRCRAIFIGAPFGRPGLGKRNQGLDAERDAVVGVLRGFGVGRRLHDATVKNRRCRPVSNYAAGV